MREGWEKKPLLDVAHIVMGQSPPGTSYNLIGDGLPFIQGSAEFGERHPAPVKWCTDPRKIAESGDLLLSVRAPVGDLNIASERIAVGRGLSIIRGHDELATTSYLGHALAFGTHELAKRSSTGMFTSITGAQLKSLPVAVPPLHEQKRIVDLMDSVDAAISAAQSEVDAAEGVLRKIRSAIPVAPSSTPLGDLVKMRSGPSWKAADETAVPGPGLEPVLGITNTPASGQVDLSTRKYVRGLSATTQRLTDNSLVMIRTNGNRSRIGNVYRSTPEVEGFAVSAFQIAIEPIDKSDSEFLYWILGSDPVQDSITENASGSTGLGNIAIGWLKRLGIPKLDESARTEYVENCNAANVLVTTSATALNCLRELRSSMLSVLLSGEHAIPETYDQFLDLSEVVQAG